MRARIASHFPLFLVLSLFLSSGVLAQPERTFVSGGGNDANPCSVTSPCRTFQRAHDVVAANGEIVPLDSAGYSSLVVTKSVSITAPDGVYAGITTTTDGVTVNTADVSVYLRGVAIVYAGVPATMSYAVKLVNGASIFLDRCRMKDFDYGLYVDAPAKATVKDSVITGNAIAGLYSSDLNARVSVTGCTLDRNVVAVRSAFGTWLINNCLISGNDIGIYNYAMGQEMVVNRSTISKNEVGVDAAATARIRLVNSIIKGNTQGLFTATGGQILSRSPLSNTLEANTTDGVFTGTYAAR